MGFFEELKKNPEIKNHPIFRNADLHIKRSRKIAEGLSKDDLKDEFLKSPMLDTGPKERNDLVADAVKEVEAAVHQFDWPMPPVVHFVGMKKAKFATHDPRKVINAELNFTVDFVTKTGATLQLDVPVSVNRGNVIPPSTFYFENRQYIFGQKAVDAIIKRNTSYYVEPMRRMYEPVFNKQEQQIAAQNKYEQGYKARENDGMFGGRGIVKDRRLAQWNNPAKLFGISYDRLPDGRVEVPEDSLNGVEYGMFDSEQEAREYIETCMGDKVEPWQKAKKAQFEDMDDEEAFRFLNKQVKQLGKDFQPGFDDISDRSEILDEIAEFLEADEDDPRFARRRAQDIDYEEGQIFFGGTHPNKTKELYERIQNGDFSRQTDLYSNSYYGFDDLNAIAKIEQNPKHSLTPDRVSSWFEENEEEYEDSWNQIVTHIYNKMKTTPSVQAKKARQHKKPAAFDQVVKLMESAKDLGTDSFPRMYEHIEKEYILDVLSTASRDEWEMHLINDGWCINSKERLFRKKRAQIKNKHQYSNFSRYPIGDIKANVSENDQKVIDYILSDPNLKQGVFSAIESYTFGGGSEESSSVIDYLEDNLNEEMWNLMDNESAVENDLVYYYCRDENSKYPFGNFK